ncbi:hypothetical protein KUTeg_016924 [Tegillarca granosa]|uniref:Uncharacterized protein n=1 Tax=Tegillarca granosa TaxID=220873 RepID=A0ABQ9EM86_TEGGR|nr:hypothetical protein KUTeg_016924 [Tegillarca granosa]
MLEENIKITVSEDLQKNTRYKFEYDIVIVFTDEDHSKAVEFSQSVESKFESLDVRIASLSDIDGNTTELRGLENTLRCAMYVFLLVSSNFKDDDFKRYVGQRLEKNAPNLKIELIIRFNSKHFSQDDLPGLQVPSLDFWASTFENLLDLSYTILTLCHNSLANLMPSQLGTILRFFIINYLKFNTNNVTFNMSIKMKRLTSRAIFAKPSAFGTRRYGQDFSREI